MTWGFLLMIWVGTSAPGEFHPQFSTPETCERARLRAIERLIVDDAISRFTITPCRAASTT